VSVSEKLSKRAARARLSISSDTCERLAAYFELLRKWNRRVSLTALPVEEIGDEAVDRLLIEPLLAAKWLPASTNSTIDVGSGGGSPAIPLKIAAPETFMRMVESKTRKAAFLREAIRILHLERTEVEAVRLEQLLVRPDLHESADVVTMRAVRVDAKALAGLQSFLRPGGQLFLFGSGEGTPRELTSPHFVVFSQNPLLKQWGSHLQILQKRHL
jgi:16S rRNA (guanine527-N7)-methyltransferase